MTQLPYKKPFTAMPPFEFSKKSKLEIVRQCLFVCICFISLWILPWVAHSQCQCGYDDGQFTINQSILLDGSFGDWPNVLADMDNNICDGGEPDIEPQPDRDAPVQSTGRDLIHFAYTWDDTSVYTYTSRIASSSNVQRFIYYADGDNDALMETGEPVIVAQWKGSNRDVRLYLGTYQADNPGGDSMVDGDGYGDGYRLPGTATGFPPVGSPDYQGDWGSSNGLVMEWGVPWSDLGIPAGTPFSFHVSSTNSQPGAASFPEQVDDNMGGCGGGSGSTQYADLTFVPDRSIEGDQGATVYCTHTLTNTGNGNDTFDLASSPSGDHTPAVSYYRDADGSGTFTAGDTLLTDTDGDGTPDTGQLASGESLDILIAYTIGGSSTGTASVVTAATSNYDPNTSKSVTDIIEVILYPDIILLKSSMTSSDPVNGEANPKAIPGALILYSATATNQGAGAGDPDTVVIMDPIPANMALFVGDINGPGSGPVLFEDGTTPSGLTYTFINLSSTTDDVDFSSDGGATYTYTPTPDGDGFDSNVTHLRINPKGSFNGASGGNNPSFALKFAARVE